MASTVAAGPEPLGKSKVAPPKEIAFEHLLRRCSALGTELDFDPSIEEQVAAIKKAHRTRSGKRAERHKLSQRIASAILTAEGLMTGRDEGVSWGLEP